jgi:hypothetical protein
MYYAATFPVTHEMDSPFCCDDRGIHFNGGSFELTVRAPAIAPLSIMDHWLMDHWLLSTAHSRALTHPAKPFVLHNRQGQPGIHMIATQFGVNASTRDNQRAVGGGPTVAFWEGLASALPLAPCISRQIPGF